LSGTNNIYVYYTSPITQVIAPGQGTVTTTSLATNFTLPVASGGTGLTAVPHTVTVYTSGSGTYTTPANVKAIFVQCWGGGGSGGGGNGASGRGVGGGGGGYSQKLIASPSATYSYAVGAGGTAATQGNNGNTGGTTTFGTSLLTCNGGTGGATATGVVMAGVSGGAASGGDLNITGGGSITLNGAAFAAPGGNSPLGGSGGTVNVTDPGVAPGGGGANANYTGSSGAGATGTILITEFYV
jgi:hypothetical protein